MESVFRDFRHAARALWLNPGFAAVAILTIALGIGPTTAVFSVVYGVLLRPLPFPNADRLVQIVQLEPRAAGGERPRAGLSPDQFVNLQEHSKTLEAVGMFAHSSRTLTGITVPARLNGAAVTTGLLDGLGVLPLRGRALRGADALTGADPVVVLSERTWRRYFAGDDRIVGSRIDLGDARPQVVGVMPAAFRFPSLAGPSLSTNSEGELEDAPEFWLPLPPFSRTGPATGFSIFKAWALLAPGSSLQQAADEVRAIAGPLPDGRRLPIELADAREEMGLPARRVRLVFQAGVAMILLIAAVNVINLLATRLDGRRHELAIRAALGAGRGRIAREVMSEALLLAIAGGALGCVFAFALADALQWVPPHILPRLRDIRIDRTVLGFVVAISVVTGLGVGLLSAMRIGRADPSRWLPIGPGSGAAAPGRFGPSSALAVFEIAAAVILLTASGLLVHSFIRLVRVDLGYDPVGVLSFEIQLPANRYADRDALNRFYDSFSTALRGTPGVQEVGAMNRGGLSFDAIAIDDQPPRGGESWFAAVTPGYFAALRLPLRDGRDFSSIEDAGSVIVNETFARRYIGPGGAIGRRIGWTGWFGTREIVGVVADSRRTFDAGEEPFLYLPAAEDGLRQLTMYVRSESEPLNLAGPVRSVLRQMDPGLAAFNLTSLEAMLAHRSATNRLHSLVSLACATVALLLAAIGLYGVLAYSVRARWNELGIRIALGASTGTVMRGVLRQGLVLTAVGLIIGIAGGYLAATSLSGLLFGIDPHDVPTFAGVGVLLVATAALASYLPARRATRVDPVVALRAP